MASRHTFAHATRRKRDRAVGFGTSLSSIARVSSPADDAPALGEYGVCWVARREPCFRTCQAWMSDPFVWGERSYVVKWRPRGAYLPSSHTHAPR